MRWMDDSNVSYPVLYTLLNGAMLGGGSIVAAYVWRWHRRNPPDREQCTESLLARAWGTFNLAFLFLAIVLFYLLAAGGARFFEDEQMPTVQLVFLILINTLMIAVIGLLNRKRGVTWEAGFGMGSGQLHLLRFSPMLYLAMIPFLMIITQGYHWILDHWFGLELTIQDAAQAIAEERAWLQAGYVLAAVIIAPVYEELIFRGVLFPYIARHMGVNGAIFSVSILFGLIHFHVPSIVPLFVLSVVLCIAYWRSGSLWVSIGIHVLFNAVGTLAIKLVY